MQCRWLEDRADGSELDAVGSILADRNLHTVASELQLRIPVGVHHRWILASDAGCFENASCWIPRRFEFEVGIVAYSSCHAR